MLKAAAHLPEAWSLRKVALEGGKVTNEANKMSSNQSKTIADHRKMISDRDKVIADHRKMTDDHGKMIADHDKVINHRSAMKSIGQDNEISNSTMIFYVKQGYLLPELRQVAIIELYLLTQTRRFLMPKKSIDQRLLEAKVTIENALSDSEILGLVTPFGYDEARLIAAKTARDNAEMLHQKQKTEYGEQHAATGILEQGQAQANKEYMRCVKLGRVGLKDNTGALLKLGLVGRRKEDIAGWLIQVKQFYSNALADPAIIADLAKVGVLQERLEAGQQLYEAVEAAKLTQEKERGDAQQATLDRNNAVAAVAEWKADFTVIARVALEDKPQLLEKLGIFEAS